MYKKFLLLAMVFSGLCYAAQQEKIVDFKDNSVPVLNNELRKFGNSIDNNSSDITSNKGKVMTDSSDTAEYLGQKVKNSIEIDSNDLQLVGDEASPGNNMLYGTDGSGTKGWQAAGSEVFTSSGTFTVPTGITEVFVTLVGGGGGGGSGGSPVSQGGGGGGSAAYFIRGYINGLTPGDTVSVTIGAGGAGGVANDNTGSAGGSSSFGSYITANGGGGGPAGNNAAGTAGGAAGTASGALGVAMPTLAGWTGSAVPSSTTGARGASSPFGIGSAGGVQYNNAPDATGYGAGGGGGGENGGNGGDGSSGVVIVEW